jgi:hypothetical protein
MTQRKSFLILAASVLVLMLACAEYVGVQTTAALTTTITGEVYEKPCMVRFKDQRTGLILPAGEFASGLPCAEFAGRNALVFYGRGRLTGYLYSSVYWRS